jgi:hypothetical protein
MATFSTAKQTTADLEANASLAKALSPYATANRVLVQTAMTEQGKNWRAAVKAIETFNNAINTGSASTYMRALVDLAALPLEHAPAAADLLSNVEKVRQLQQNLGSAPTSPAIAAQIWQTLTVQNPGGAQAYGNVQELKRITGIQDDAAVLEMLKRNGTDAYAYGIVEQTLNQAKMQQAAIDHQRGLQGNLAVTSAQDLIAQYPDGVPEDVAQQWKDAQKGPLLSARSQVGMNNLLKIANEEANRKPELTGIAKDTYDFNVEMQKRLLEQSTTESDRDRAAAIINSPKFQEYARSNGFTIGTVTAPDPNKQYEKAELTTSGLYSPGRDDYKAIMLFQRQLSQDPNKWHPFMPQGAGTRGNLQEYGSINVQLAPPGAAPTPAAAPEPPPAQELTDAAGWKYRLYNGEMSVVGGPKGAKTKATPENPLKLPPETARKALQEIFAANGFSADEAFAETEASLADSKAAAPSEAALGKAPETETVYGAFNKKFGADPIGSQRVSGKLYLKDASTGNFYLAPDQSTRAEGTTLTAGGGPNALKAFAEEVRARREANIARRGLSKEDGAKAPLRSAAIGLAQDLTPTQQTPAEEARAVEYNRQQEMSRRALEQVAAEAPTSQQEAVLRAQQALDTANANQGILGKEFYNGAGAPITSVPHAPYTPQSTLPNAAGSGAGKGVVPAPATPRTEALANRAETKSEGTKLGGTPKTPPLSKERQAAQEANVRRDLAATAPASTPIPPAKPGQRQALLEQKPQYRDLLTVPTAKSTNTPSPAMTQYVR